MSGQAAANYGTGPSYGLGTIVGQSIMLALAIFVVLLRVYSRTITTRFFGIDDWVLLSALIFAIANFVIFCLYIHFGGGRHIYDIEPSSISHVLSMLWATQWAYCCCVGLIKISIVSLYIRLFPGTNFRYILHFTRIILVLATLSFTLAFLLQCIPISHIYDSTSEPHCMNREALRYAFGGWCVASDFVVLLLPMSHIWSLISPRKERLSLVVLFSLGLCACVISVVRLYSIHFLTETKDITWAVRDILICSFVESNLGIITASLAAMRPLLNNVFPRGLTHSLCGEPRRISKEDSRNSDSTGTVARRESESIEKPPMDKTPWRPFTAHRAYDGNEPSRSPALQNHRRLHGIQSSNESNIYGYLSANDPSTTAAVTTTTGASRRISAWNLDTNDFRRQSIGAQSLAKPPSIGQAPFSWTEGWLQDNADSSPKSFRADDEEASADYNLTEFQGSYGRAPTEYFPGGTSDPWQADRERQSSHSSSRSSRSAASASSLGRIPENSVTLSPQPGSNSGPPGRRLSALPGISSALSPVPEASSLHHSRESSTWSSVDSIPATSSSMSITASPYFRTYTNGQTADPLIPDFPDDEDVAGYDYFGISGVGASGEPSRRASDHIDPLPHADVEKTRREE